MGRTACGTPKPLVAKVSELTLPRIKTKRRRRRPPNKRERRAIVMYVWCVFWVLADVGFFAFDLRLDNGLRFLAIVEIFFAVVMALLAKSRWPTVASYIKNGFEDDE